MTAEGAQAAAQSRERLRFIFTECPVPPHEGPLPLCGSVNPFLRQVLLARHALARVFARWSRLDALRCRVKAESNRAPVAGRSASEPLQDSAGLICGPWLRRVRSAGQ